MTVVYYLEASRKYFYFFYCISRCLLFFFGSWLFNFRFSDFLWWISLYFSFVVISIWLCCSNLFGWAICSFPLWFLISTSNSKLSTGFIRIYWGSCKRVAIFSLFLFLIHHLPYLFEPLLLQLLFQFKCTLILCLVHGLSDHLKAFADWFRSFFNFLKVWSSNSRCGSFFQLYLLRCFSWSGEWAVLQRCFINYQLYLSSYNLFTF